MLNWMGFILENGRGCREIHEGMAEEDQDQVERRSRLSCLSGLLIEKK